MPFNNENENIIKVKSLNTKASSMRYQVDDLLEIAFKLGEANPKTALKSASIAIKKAESIDYMRGKLQALFYRIRANASCGDFEGCIADYYRITDIKDYTIHLENSELAEIHRIVAFAFSFKGEFDMSKDCGINSLDLFKELDDTLGIAKVNNMLGAVSFIKNDFGNGYVYYTNAIDYLKNKEDKNTKEVEELAIAYSNLGYLFTKFEDFEQSEYYANLSIELIQQTDNLRLESIFLNILATCYIHSDKCENALYILDDAINRCAIEKYTGAYIGLLSTKALSLYLLKEYDEALKTAQLCIDISEENEIFINNYWSAQCTYCACLVKKEKYNEALDSYEGFKDNRDEGTQLQVQYLLEALMQTYEHLGDYKNAFEISKEYAKVSKSISDLRRKSKLQKFEIEYKTQEKEKEIIAQKMLLDNEKEFKRLIQEEYENQQDFLNILAHDLKAPMRTIKSFNDLATKKNEASEPIKVKEFLKLVSLGIDNMASFVEDLLSYARAGKIDQTIKTVDLNLVVEKVKANLANDITEKSAIIESCYLPIIQANETPLIQLFQNIIVNSLKYCHAEKIPQIRINCELKDGEYLFSIKDNARGIPELLLKEIFKPFRRNLDDTTIKGHGLGLASCKKIVESYKGDIWVESKENQGSTFYFTLKT